MLPGLFNDARHLAIDGAGKLYVADYKGGRLQVFDTSGQFQSLWSLADSEAYVIELAAGRSDTVYIRQGSDIHRYNSATGKYLGQLEYRPEVGSSKFTDMAVTAKGELVALCGGLATPGLVRLDAQGNVLQVVSFDTVEQAASFNQVAVDGLGNIYVLGSGYDTLQKMNNVVFRFDANGKDISRFGSSGNEPGQFVAPDEIAVDGQGRIYVSDMIISDNLPLAAILVFDSNDRYLGFIDTDEAVSDMVFNSQNELWVLLIKSQKVVKFAIQP